MYAVLSIFICHIAVEKVWIMKLSFPMNKTVHTTDVTIFSILMNMTLM